jgi:hypothetical protein
MRIRAGFHADQAFRPVLKEPGNLAAPELTAQQWPTLGVDTVQLENGLRKIDPNCGKLFHG